MQSKKPLMQLCLIMISYTTTQLQNKTIPRTQTPNLKNLNMPGQQAQPKWVESVLVIHREEVQLTDEVLARPLLEQGVISEQLPQRNSRRHRRQDIMQGGKEYKKNRVRSFLRDYFY